jgi:cellulose synthase/poly-beta-1,6-N-acetylglucosamine synthase-like glycosyltransferase
MIVTAMHGIILAAAAIVAVPVAVLLLETVAAVSGRGAAASRKLDPTPRGRVAVLIPAHDEEEGLPASLANVKPQLRQGDRLLVVADNCSDGTERVARELGAEAVVRTDPVNRGKGFALDFGVRRLADDPPAVVIVLDADCTLDDAALDLLATTCEATGRPVQARYLMTAPADAAAGARLREFAWRVKNWTRPLGLHAVGLPCQLMGTGMAFPWDTIARADLATGALAEDLKLGLELAAEGRAPLFCPPAIVTSAFPTSGEGSRSQQRRWEQGHLSIIATTAPRAFASGLRRADLNRMALALDAAVPPLSLLWLMVLATLAASLCAWLTGGGAASLVVSLGSLAGFVCAALACWFMDGRDILPFRSLMLVGARALTKVPLYFSIVFLGRDQKWIRTDRRKS